jgi:DNA-directed RNA polymerase specialized sigma24 family protein
LYEQLPELSPDLEWMLLSGQAGEDMIINALIDEGFTSVYRLPYLVLNDPPSARRMAVEVLATALLERHGYSGQEGVQVWLAHLTLQVCAQIKGASGFQPHRDGDQVKSNPEQSIGPGRVVSSQPEMRAALARQLVSALDEPLRLPLFLQASFDLSPAELAFVLGTNEETVSRRLESAQRQIGALLGENSLHESHTPSVAGFIREHLPPSILPESDREHLRQAISNRVHYLQHTRRRRARFQEIGLVGLVVVVVATSIFIANRFVPKPTMVAGILSTTTQSAARAAPASTATQAMPTPVTPVPALPPLTLEASPEDIRQRMQSFQPAWHTSWANILIVHNGPAGYIGPPRIERHQIWLSRRQGALWLNSHLFASTIQVNRFMDSGPGIYDEIQDVGRRIPWFTLSLASSPEGNLILNRLSTAIFENTVEEGEIDLVGADQIAGRETLILDKTLMKGSLYARIWMDAITGVALREQYFEDAARRLALLDVIVQTITYDVDFPAHLLDPNFRPAVVTAFVADHTGLPLPAPEQLEDLSFYNPNWRLRLSTEPAPPDFDPSQSQLTFQYPTDYTLSSGQEAIAAVFAGEYYLGDLLTGDPFYLHCKRSPDGHWLATLNKSPEDEYPPRSVLSWANLLSLAEIEIPFPEAQTNEFYFSPDSKRLAFRVNQTTQLRSSVSVYIADLTSSKVHHVIDWGRGPLVGWTLDGDHLLLMDWQRFGDQLVALHPETGQTYEGKILGSGPTVTYTFPDTGWEVEYSFSTSDLGACVAPPEAEGN